MPDSSQFSFSKESHLIFEDYLGTVQKLLIEVEVVTGKFPVQVLNEIRSAFTHLARASRDQGTLPASALEECQKAQPHIKRARLDCYKALCIAYDDAIVSFESEHKDTNLGLADNGRFLKRFTEMREEARTSFVEARRAESEGVQQEEEIFALYEVAYKAFSDAQSFLVCDEVQESLVFARQMTDKNKELMECNTQLTQQVVEEVAKSKRSSRASIALGVVSAVLAIVSIVEAFLLAIVA